MVTGSNENGVVTIYGLSTDTKPINKNLRNGTKFIEMDTSHVYFYDEQNKQWWKER